MSDDAVILECRNLTKSYVSAKFEVNVFQGVNLVVKPGEMVAITGASGSGKSTFLHLLGGLDSPTSGCVRVLGKDFSSLSENGKANLRNQHMGFVYQFHHLLPEFSALENVCMPLWIRGEKHSIAKKKASSIIDKVGLSHRASHRIGELSGGERQRIAIARALVTEPDCVLADEPTGNLDGDTSDQVFELMLALNKNLGTSFVMVTHSQRLADKLDKKYLIDRGFLSLIE